MHMYDVDNLPLLCCLSSKQSCHFEKKKLFDTLNGVVGQKKHFSLYIRCTSIYSILSELSNNMTMPFNCTTGLLKGGSVTVKFLLLKNTTHRLWREGSQSACRLLILELYKLLHHHNSPLTYILGCNEDQFLS